MRQALKDFAAAAGLVLVCALLALALPVQAQVPQAAQQYRALLVRTAHAVWGLDAPVAVLAAQIHQESAWNAQAISRVGAQIGATKAQLKQAEGSFSELQRKIAETPKPTRVMINEFNKAEKALNQLKTKQGEMITRHAQMGEAMRKTGINTGNLSETQRRLKTDLAAANTVLDSQRTKLGQLADQQKRLNQVKASYRQTQELRGQIAGHGATALATGTAMGLTTLKPVIEFARAETSVVDLKVSMMGKGGQVRQEFQSISDLATKLGNKLPGTTADFQNMMSTLIQQGMSAKSILGGLGEATT